MGYHDLNPISFLVSEAVRDTNTAEEAALYESWLRMCKEKVKAFSEEKTNTKDTTSLSHNS
jgi:hypothetical protein